LALVASDDKNLRLFKIDEENKNRKELGVEFQDIAIKNAKFIGQNHEEIVICGRRPFYYTYDLTSGHVSKIPSKLLLSSLSTDLFSPPAFTHRRVKGNGDKELGKHVCFS
jgi:hypothetical protein